MTASMKKKTQLMETVMTKLYLPKVPDRQKLVFDDASLRSSIGQENGEERVGDIHEKRYDSLYGGRIVSCEEFSDQLDKEKTYLQKSLKKSRESLSGTNSTLPNDEDEISQPWNIMSIMTVTILGLAILTLLGVSFGTIYSNLMATGEAVFIENPWIAVLFGFIPMGVSFALKTMIDHFQTDRAKRIAIYLIFTLGIILGLVWITLFAYLFNGLGQSVSDIVNDLVAEENTIQNLLEKAYVAVQLVTEILVAAGFWLMIKHMYDLHHQIPPKVNPKYISLQHEVKKLDGELTSLNNRRAVVQYRLDELKNLKAVYIQDAITEFHLLQSQFLMKNSSMHVVPRNEGKRK